MVRPDCHTDIPFKLVEQTLQLEYPLARNDNLPAALPRLFQCEIAQRQPVPIGRHGAHVTLAYLDQHAVQEVTHILLGHGEAGAVQQLLERLAVKPGRHFGRRSLHRRKIRGRQR